MQRKIIHNGTSLEYSLEYKQVKNINLRVRADGSIYVSAPRKVPLGVIESFISSNFEKIISAREKILHSLEQRANESQILADGAVIRISGCDTVLRIECSSEAKAEFSENERVLRIFLPDDSPDSIEKAYKKWKTEYCLEIFTEILREVYPKFAPYGVPMPKLRIREMKSRWGSCIPSKNVITLNSRLSAYPKECAEYVTVHELCHFLEANHSARFYGWMDKMLPDWRERKEVMSRNEK